MADLQQLLDHQLDDKHNRLAIQASGGSPGATLAGALSTATHGGEFTSPLLVDEVRAIHLVGPGGQQWWIEGDFPVADPIKLHQRYPALDAAHFIGGGWNGIPGLNAQDVLDAVTVSMGTMGVIYSVVLHVAPQFGLRQVVRPTDWDNLLLQAKVSVQDLQAGKVAANTAVLEFLKDGAANGTGISKVSNVYIDLAINPINRQCWIVNREKTPALPDDSNTPAPALGDFVTALSRELGGAAEDKFNDSRLLGRVFDFLSWATDIADVKNDVEQAGRLAGFINSLKDPLGGTLAAATVQTAANVINAASHADRGFEFLGNVLSGFFHALEGTQPGQNSDHTGISYKVGAIGWPDSGLPGRALEIALDPSNAFTFLQTVLIDDVFNHLMFAGNNPFFGYISVRVCPPTKTMLGMQQFSPHSVMIEVVSYRSPYANNLMDVIQSKALSFKTKGPKPLLHWGLENDQLTPAYLATTPLGAPFKGFKSKLDAFTAIRNFLAKGHPKAFDNNFSNRLNL